MKHVFLVALCASGLALSAVPALSQTPGPAAPLSAASTGSLASPPRTVPLVTDADLLKRAGDEWLSYHGDYSGQRHAYVDQINRRTVSRLKRAWVSDTTAPVSPGGRRGPPGGSVALPGRTGSNVGSPLGGVRSSPLFHAGMLFYTIGQNAYAIDARSGRQVWHYVADSVGGISNRGLGISGDTLFMIANGGLTAIDAKTGAERWRRSVGGTLAPFAPMVVRQHVYANTGSGRGVSRTSVESRNVVTGEREWIWHVVPDPGEPGAETWPSVASMVAGGGSPWQPLTYDPQLNLLYFGTGNPDPQGDGSARPGDNLFTSTIVAINADTGVIKWHFQATPHDDHDYDATQVTMLVDRRIAGRDRKLLVQAGRNGFFMVLDRVTGENLRTQKIFPEVNWSLHNRPNGSPQPELAKSSQPGGVLVFPSSEGVTNWPAPAYSPQTGLVYFNAVKNRSVVYPGGSESFLGDFRNSLRAIDPVTGKTAWVHEYQEPYGIHARYPGVLSTAGGLVFTGDISGNVVAFDAASGAILWHDELPRLAVTNAPVSYTLDGKQYVAVGSGDQIIAYAIP